MWRMISTIQKRIPMETGLRGKTVLVTGASRGLGFACACAFAAEGARLVLFSRDEASLQASAASIRSEFNSVIEVVAGDMAVTADVARLSEKAGAPDVLVLNCGRPPLNLREVLDETDQVRWEHAHRTQLTGGVNVLAALAPKMVARGKGRIVAITSASVKQPMPRHGLSTIFRAGLAAYLKHLANEVAASGVTVNSVCPASIGTEGFLRSFDAQKRASEVPMRRLGTPEELASAVVYLASDGAGFITGVSLQVDGGMTASLV